MNVTKMFNGCSLQISGQYLRRACLFDEAWVDGDVIPDGEAFSSSLRASRIGADVFSFFRPLPEARVRFSMRCEWENVAAAPTHSFQEWWEGLPQESRKNMRRAEKRGVIVRVAAFGDELVRGISEIYNETPLRQGRKFWHYRKPIDQVKRENGTYLDRGTFIGAYHSGELIGFLKFVRVNSVGRIMQILSKDAHADKRTTNALLGKAVECCAQAGLSHLVYGEYVYGRKENSPMTEFKRRNGFVRLDYPRYVVPLTLKGSVCVRLGLHRGLLRILPEQILTCFLRIRHAYYTRTLPAETRRGKDLLQAC